MNATTVLVLFAGYLASFIPPLAWLCIAAAVAGALLYLVLFSVAQPARRPVRKQISRRYTNAAPAYRGRRWPLAVGCPA